MDLTHGDTRLIIDTCKKYGLLRNQAAYVLATAWHETAHTMKPVREYGGEEYLKKKKYHPYVGMGYVQLTWKANYIRASDELDVDFVKNPKLLLKAQYAAPILVIGSRDGWFTTKRLADYMTLYKSDFVGARRIINGTDKASLIAGYARTYDTLLKAEGYGETGSSLEDTQPWTPPPHPKPVVVHVDPDGSVKPGSSPVKTVERNPIWAAFLAILKAIFRRGK